MIFTVDEDIRNRFKSATAREGHKMQEILEGFVLAYLVEREMKSKEVKPE